MLSSSGMAMIDLLNRTLRGNNDATISKVMKERSYREQSNVNMGLPQ